MKSLLVLVLFLWGQSSFGITRFEKDQLKFTLIESSGQSYICAHEALKNGSANPPPWWRVICDDRQYTVDIWMNRTGSKEGINNILLLFHASEGAKSSGEKLTQFKNQTTKFSFYGSSPLLRITSSLDVRNGLADLEVVVSGPF